MISKIMLHTGNHAAEITPNDVVDYHRAAWRLRGKADGAGDAWDHPLTGFGGFPGGTLSFRGFVRQGPMTVTEMAGFISSNASRSARC